jgi:multiple sugar transport system permease protein
MRLQGMDARRAALELRRADRAEGLGSALLRGLQRDWLGIVCLLPAIIVLAAVLAYPMVYSFWMSFQSYNLITSPVWRGFGNYVDALRSDLFWNAVRVSLTFTVGSFIIEFLLGFGLALLVERPGLRGKSIYRTIFITPILLTPVVVGLNWRVMLNRDYGIVNYLLGLIGVPLQGWTISASMAMPTLIFVDVWHTTAFVMLILSAGLASLPLEPFEAARIDGAASWQILWHITLPLLRQLILVICLWRSLNLIQMFDIAYTLTEGGPGRATQTLSLYDYSVMFSGYQVGEASAISYLIFLLCLIVGLVLIKILHLQLTE